MRPIARRVARRDRARRLAAFSGTDGVAFGAICSRGDWRLRHRLHAVEPLRGAAITITTSSPTTPIRARASLSSRRLSPGRLSAREVGPPIAQARVRESCDELRAPALSRRARRHGCSRSRRAVVVSPRARPTIRASRERAHDAWLGEVWRCTGDAWHRFALALLRASPRRGVRARMARASRSRVARMFEDCCRCRSPCRSRGARVISSTRVAGLRQSFSSSSPPRRLTLPFRCGPSPRVVARRAGFAQESARSLVRVRSASSTFRVGGGAEHRRLQPNGVHAAVGEST